MRYLPVVSRRGLPKHHEIQMSTRRTMRWTVHITSNRGQLLIRCTGLTSTKEKTGLTTRSGLANLLGNATPIFVHSCLLSTYDCRLQSLRGAIVLRKPIQLSTHKTMKMYTHKYRCMNRIRYVNSRHGRIWSIYIHDLHYDTVGSTTTRCFTTTPSETPYHDHLHKRR